MSSRSDIQLSEQEAELLSIIRDPGAYLATLTSQQKVAYHLWLHTGDLRLAAFIFPKQFQQESIPLLGIHTPKGTQQFAFRFAYGAGIVS